MAALVENNESSPLLTGQTDLDNVGHHGRSNPKKSIDYGLALKIGAAMVSFTSLGLFNSSIGAVLPLVSSYYSLTDIHVSLLFLASPFGYILAASFSDAIHWRFGQRGIAVIGPLFQLVATLMIAQHPRFGWVLVAFALQGLGMGLLDGSWCAWAGSMEKANTISGLLHGSYSVGGAAGPFLVTTITTNGRPWYLWYYVLVSICYSRHIHDG
jgi:fucose permease